MSAAIDRRSASDRLTAFFCGHGAQGLTDQLDGRTYSRIVLLRGAALRPPFPCQKPIVLSPPSPLLGRGRPRIARSIMRLIVTGLNGRGPRCLGTCAPSCVRPQPARANYFGNSGYPT